MLTLDDALLPPEPGYGMSSAAPVGMQSYCRVDDDDATRVLCGRPLDEREVLFNPAETDSGRARLLCELEARHVGPHWALGDNGGETEDCAGLAWTDDGGRELVVQVDFCPAHGAYPKYDAPDWICALRLGHLGAHCFEMDGVDYGDDLS